MKRILFGIIAISIAFLLSCTESSNVEPSNNDNNNKGDYQIPELGQGVDENEYATTFILNDENGVAHNLKDYRGKVVLLKFWEPWCSICKRRMPELRTIRENYSIDDLEIITVSLDQSDEVWQNSLIEHQMNDFINLRDDFILYVDRAGPNDELHSARSYYGINGVPTYLIIGKNGIIEYKGSAAQSTLEAEINELLN